MHQPTSLILRSFLAPVILALALAACSGGTQSARQPVTVLPTSSLTRDSAVAIMRSLEADPLAASAPGDRMRAFEWLASNPETRDIAIDGRYLRPLEESEYPFAGELLMQFAFGLAIHRLSPEGAESEQAAQVEAGLRSVIATYRNIVAADRKLSEQFLDDLDQIRRLGRLRDYISKVDEQSR